MCGRFTLHTDSAVVAEQFALNDVPNIPPRYNIAPTQQVATVHQADTGRAFVPMRWGLVPSWASDPAIGTRMINARAETVASKPAFRAAFKQRRCLVLADGFYEWQAGTMGSKKQPFYILMQDRMPFAFAGLWETWQGTESTLYSCTIITTTPNDLMQPIHSRMPVILRPDEYALWLDPHLDDQATLESVLQPFAAESMAAYPVSTTVNNVRNDSPACIAPAQS